MRQSIKLFFFLMVVFYIVGYLCTAQIDFTVWEKEFRTPLFGTACAIWLFASCFYYMEIVKK